MHRREAQFVTNYFDHSEWEYEPVTFHLGRLSYKPDFYDKRNDAYIEVVGTRQAYNQNKAKYDLFKIHYPERTLLVLDVFGEPYGRKKSVAPCGRRRKINLPERKEGREKRPNTISKRIRELRRAANITQVKLSELMDLSGSSPISQWESGYVAPKHDNMKRLAEIFGVTVNDLVYDCVEAAQPQQAQAGSYDFSI